MRDRKKDRALQEFLSESEELLDSLHQQLDVIERRPDAISPETLNAMFRSAHTLKGMSGVMGLDDVSNLAHALEDVMDQVRMDKIRMSRDLSASLTDGVDLLGRMIGASATGHAIPDSTDLVRRLRNALNLPAGTGTSGGDAGITGIDPEIERVLTEYERHRLEETIKAKRRLFEIRAQFRFEDFDTALSALSQKLQAVGEVISTLPGSGVSPDAGISFTLLVGTTYEPEAMSSYLSGDKVEVKSVGPRRSLDLKDPVVQMAPSGGSVTAKSLSQSIRVDIEKLDGLLNMLGELVLSKSVIVQVARDLFQTEAMVGPALELHKAAQALEHRLAGLQEGLIEVRMVPVMQLFDRSVRAIRKISRDLGKEIEVTTAGEDTKLDKSMVEAVTDPLLHLIRNALDHGIESSEERLKAGKPEVGSIHLSAEQKGHTVSISVRDDGAGIDVEKVRRAAVERGLAEADKSYGKKETINFLFQPGFSTAQEVTELSGRGVGLDVVARHITKLNGTVEVETDLGRGTTFVLTLPITLVIIKALIVGVGPQTFAVPISAVSETVMVPQGDVRTVGQQAVVNLRHRTLPLLRLSDLFGITSGDTGEGRIYIIVVGTAERRLGLVVDTIVGQQEIVIKTVGTLLQGIPGIAGATELGNRKTILVLDVGGILDEVGSSSSPSMSLAA